MKLDLGAKLAVYPTPVYLVATYDAEGKPNIMTVGWGGICNSNPPCVCISVRPATHTYHALMERKAFTVNIATAKFMEAAAYCGKVSGKTENKFEKTGLTPVRSEVVDAPYIEEVPVNVECKVIQTHEIGSHTQFIGQIINVKMDAELADAELPAIESLKPIVYGVGDNYRYYELREGVSVKV